MHDIDLDVVFYISMLILAVAAEMILILLACRQFGKAKRIKDTPTSKIGEVTNGWREIKGRIVATKGKEQRLITAPLTGKECVYYEFTVTHTYSSGQSGSTTATIIHDKKNVEWHLADDTGTANIDLDGAELVLDTEREESGTGMLNPASPRLEAILAKYNKSAVERVFGFDKAFDKALEYKETILEVGDELYILGPAKVVKGNVCFKTISGQPLTVSDIGERALVKRYEWEALLYTLGAVLALVAIVALITLKDLITLKPFN
jgi:hypothetical protein